jgi:predicted dehydrogenase
LKRHTLKIAVLGGGVFGRYHVQKALAHEKVSDVVFYEPNAARTQAIIDEFDVASVPSAKAAIAQSDAVIIAAPALYHEELAIAALEAGKHCLIEKPLAHSLEAAQHICDLAREKNLIVHAGHQERYVLAAIGLDTIVSKPRLIEMHRENMFHLRGTDVSATLDLTVHDLDMVMWLLKGEPMGVLAMGESVQTSLIDKSRAVLIYETTKAVIHTSRVAAAPRRTMTLTYAEGTVEVDFNARSLVNKSPFMLNQDFANDPRAKDSLGTSDHDFFDAVLSGIPPIISAEDGMRALDWALQIDELILGTRV